MRGVTVKKPIVYGSMSFYQGKKADEHNSHKWACFVAGVNSEDISTFVKKVVFQLHPSFTNSSRVFDRPPYEVHESGWGEFEIMIQIHFHDSREKRIDIFHMLQLYPKQPGVSQSTKKPVINDQYDEIIFQDPYPDFYQRLTSGVPVPPDQELLENSFHLEIMQHFQTHNDASVLRQLDDAYQYIRQEAEEMREKLKKLEQETQSFRGELREEEKKLRDG